MSEHNGTDIEELERIFDGRYVRQKYCDRTNETLHSQIDKINVDTAKIGTKLNIIVAILGTIGTAICAAVVKIIFGG